MLGIDHLAMGDSWRLPETDAQCPGERQIN
jgi:hypothetical protein